MRQLKFSIEDIAKRPVSFILIFVQIICSFLMVALSTSVICSTLEYKNKFKVFEDASETYLICDNTDEDKFKSWKNDQEEESKKKMLELYDFISNNESFKSFTYVPETVIIETEEPMDVYYKKYEDGTITHSIINIDYNFAEIFGLECSEGEFFSKEDYSEDSEKKPVVLGSEYKKYYSIGDEILDNCVVIGFLKEKSFYLAPETGGDVFYLDRCIVKPLVINENSEFFKVENSITRSTLITDDRESLELITAKNQELDLFDFTYRSYTKQLENIIRDNLQMIYIALVLVFLVLFFCIICVISSMLNFIETHKREFAVHLLCGATQKDFMVRVMYQIAVIMFIADIITLIVFGLSIATLVTVLFSLLVMVIILYLPIRKISKQNVSELIKRSE